MRHRDLVLTVRVPEEHYDVALAMLQMVRSGLAYSNEGDERERACAWAGPFEVEGETVTLLTAIADEAEGWIADDPKEPIYMKEHVLLAGVRALVREAMAPPSVAAAQG